MNRHSARQTIFSLSSGKLPAGIAVIRVSGPQAAMVVTALAGFLPLPRQAVLRPLRGADGRLLDTALVLWFSAPASFTGEDCVELHCHGGSAVAAAILAELSRFDGCRLAEAGEFSLRAFINGKADLTQMEALADLIDAETESQRALAVAQAGGAQRRLYEKWRADLIKARAFLEADLDFSDEDDVPGSVAHAADLVVERMIASLKAHLLTARRAEIIRDGFRVVIGGAPNAGKSTLLNTLARRDVAIVTDIMGTTRDVLDVALDVGGVKVIVSDTAGLRETDDLVEKIGIERAEQAIKTADLVLMLSEAATDLPAQNRTTNPSITSPSGAVWHIKTKCDDDHGDDLNFDFSISCKTGRGLDGLIARIGDLAQSSIGTIEDGEMVLRTRHQALLENALTALQRFSEARADGIEFAAEELRMAADSLGRITGIISSEDVLGAIFSSFCIGK
jgi:tRNA modification GTPase